MAKNSSFCEPVSKEEVAEKFSEGYFAYLKNVNHKAGSRIKYVIAFLLVGIGFNIPMYLLIFRWNALEGEPDTSILIFALIALGWLALSSLILKFGFRWANQSVEDWMATAAKDSGLTNAKLLEFDAQIRSGEWSYLTLKGKKNLEAMEILTQDFILVNPNGMVLILPIKDIIGVCHTYYENFNNRRIRYQALGLVTGKKFTKIDAATEYSEQFMGFLREKNPEIDFAENKELSEYDFMDWTEKLQKQVSKEGLTT